MYCRLMLKSLPSSVMQNANLRTIHTHLTVVNVYRETLAYHGSTTKYIRVHINLVEYVWFLHGVLPMKYL